jgi:hypothetical protein
MWEKTSATNFHGVNKKTQIRSYKKHKKKIPYIIGKILEHRCLKWAHMIHLDTFNTIYGQKKGRESN